MSAKMSPGKVWDTVIVGGGPAGLSAALLLGRCLRTVLVCDAGKPRNSKSHVLNGFLTRDGASPQEFLHIARQQLERYETVELCQVTVSVIDRRDKHFEVILESGRKVLTKMVLLANGLVDELPEVEGMETFYGTAVHSCPFCHGWECRGKRIAVLGDSNETAELALELTAWTKDVVLCQQGRDLHGGELLERLLARGVAFEKKKAHRLEADESGNFAGLRLEDGSFLSCDAVFIYPRQHQQSSLAQSLGCTLCAEDGCIVCEDDGRTCVPGVFVAGNASRGIQLVVMACAEGTRAAVSVNEALLDAEVDELVGKR